MQINEQESLDFFKKTKVRYYSIVHGRAKELNCSAYRELSSRESGNFSHLELYNQTIMSMDTNDALAHQGHQNELHITLFNKKVYIPLIFM